MTDFGDLLIVWALVWAVVAAVFDVRFHRIPNWLTYSGILAALASRLLLLGMPGLTSGLIGGVFAGGIFLLFFMVRAMGGGDVKLIAALGSFVGWPVAVELLIATAMAGGFLAIGFMVFQKKALHTLSNVGAVLKHHLTAGIKQHPSVNLDNPEAARMPYGLAMAAGALFCVTRAFLGR
jgi:prepilin peptidase CpaA